MSKEIDEKVVEMRFNNDQFEKNVQTSLSSLEKLKSGLDFDGASKGLDEINSSVGDTSSEMSALTSGVEAVGKKFSALEVVAVAALVNITNSAIAAGKQLISSLSLDQITAGFTKYEEKTTAMQTIINATGLSLEEVNEQLDKLNWFTDETSYNFTDMVSNIGKFTSMGIDLDTSVTAMMGIANWAAVSGQGTEEASRAMYNLAQAIGVGAVKLTDWKSIENANMATQEFKEIVIETAKELGTLDEEAQTTGGTLVETSNFSSTLSEGWFTSDVLLAALEKYGNYAEEVYKVVQEEGVTAAEAMELITDDTMELGEKAFKAAQEAKTFTDAINATKDAVSTGWMNTFEIIFGNYEEAKVLWTDLANELYDIFAGGAEARNDLLSEWKELGGRDLLVDSFFNALTALENVIATVKEAFRDIFPAKTAEQLYSMTQSLYNFTERLANAEKPLDTIKRLLEGFFAVIDIGKQFFGALFKALSPVFSILKNVIGNVADCTASFSDFIVKIDKSIKESQLFDKIFEKIADVVKKTVSVLKSFVEQVKQTKIFNSIVSLLGKAKESIKSFIESIKEKFSAPSFEGFQSLLDKIYEKLKKLGEFLSPIKQAFINTFNDISEALSTSSIITVLGQLFRLLASITKAIIKLAGSALLSFAEKLSSGNFESILDLINTLSVAGVAGGAIKFFSSLSDTVTNFTEAFSGIKGVLGSVKGILDGVRGCFEAWQNKIKANTLFKIAAAVALLVGAIVVLTFVDEDKLSSALFAITMLFTGLVGAMAVLSKIGGGMRKLKVVSSILTAMAVAVLVLALAIKSLSSLDNDEMIRGIFGVASLMAILVVAVKAISSNSKTVMKGAAQIVIFALAIKVLASACKSMAKLSWGEMAKGLVGVGALMAEVAIFLNTAKFSKRCFSNAAGMLLLAVAIKILASACKTFADLEWEEIKKGLVGIGALLAELVVFTNIIKPKKMISTGIGMIAIAAAVCILASAMHSIANLSWEEIAKGLLGIAGGLAILVVALQFVPKGIISKGIGLIAVATAMLILSSALNKLGNMSWISIAKGMLTLGGAMLILAIGLNVMKGTVSGSAALLVAAIAIAALVPSLALLGSLSWKTIGKGLLSLAATFVVLGVAALVLKPVTPTLLALAAALLLVGIGTTAIGVGMIALSTGLTAFGVSFTALFGGIVAAMAIMLEGLVQLVISVATILAQGIIQFVKVIGEGAPTIMEAVKSLLLSLLNLLYEVAPELISTVLYLLVCALETLVEFAPQIIQALIDLLIACLEGILNNIDRIVETAAEIVIAFINGIAAKMPDVIQAGFNLVINFINGLADAIDNNTSTLIEAISKLIKSLLNAIKTFFSGGVDLLKDIGKNIMQGLVDGITGMWDTVKDAVTSVGNKVKNWFCDLFGINSPSKVFMEYGQYMDEGLANGIDSYAGNVEEATEEMGEDAINGMQNALDQVATLAESGEFSDPTIRPVMDLSEIQNGAGQIDQLMDNLNGYNLNGSVDIAQRASNSMSSGVDSSESSLLSGLAKSIQKMAQNQSSTFENTFNITGDNPKEIAEEVSRIIEKQVQRRNASWE